MNCLNCGKETTNPKYCSKSCSATHTNILYPKRKTKKKCSVCGYDKHVELAHIKAVSEFNVSDKLSDINNERNIIQLCRNCHWEFDNGYRDDIVLQLKHLDKDFT